MGSVHEEMNEKRFLKQGYLDTFGPGTAGYAAFMDLLKYIHEFDLRVHTHDEAMIAVGLRRAGYHLWQYLKLEPDDMVRFYVDHVRNQIGD